jgi:hypothetical protein
VQLRRDLQGNLAKLGANSMTLRSFAAPAVAALLGSALGVLAGAGGAVYLLGAESSNLDATLADGPRQSTGDQFAHRAAVAHLTRATVNRIAELGREQLTLAASLQAVRAQLRTVRGELEAFRSAPENGTEMHPRKTRSDAEIEVLVMEILERDRQARAEARTRAEQQRVADTAKLSKGPYGAYNYQVNRMSRALDLTPEQETAYYDLLAAYSETSRLLSEQIQQELTWEGPSGDEMHHRIHELLTRTAEIETEMEREFQLLLDDRQRTRLQGLPPELRRIGSPIVIADSDFDAATPMTR